MARLCLLMLCSLSLLANAGCDNSLGDPPTPLPMGCVSDDECAGDQICTDGECVRRPADCTSRDECGTGLVCRAGACEPSGACASDEDCASGERCSVTRNCIPADQCRGDGDCDAGTYCSASSSCADEGTCLSPFDCDMGRVCDETNTCVPGSDCGAEEFESEAIPPNLLIVLDRSCSMRRDVAGVPKWTSAVAAINQILTDFEGVANFGLNMFPDDEGNRCLQETEQINVAPGHETMIRTRLTNALRTDNRWYPNGPCVTNIDTAMTQAEADPAIDDDSRASYVLLITDGAQSGTCGGRETGDPITEAAITRLLSRGAKTFVVGFGGAVREDSLTLFSAAGGAPRMGTPNYFQADDADALARDLSEIVGSIVSCDYRLGENPEDLARTYAFFNDTEEVPRDTSRANGWDYDPATMTVTFYGPACDRIRDGAVEDVDIVFGCPGAVIE